MREGSYFANGSGVNYGYDGNGEMQIGQVDGDAKMAELQMPTVDHVDESLVQRAVENPMLMKRVVWMGGFETQELVAQSKSACNETHHILPLGRNIKQCVSAIPNGGAHACNETHHILPLGHNIKQCVSAILNGGAHACNETHYIFPLGHNIKQRVLASPYHILG